MRVVIVATRKRLKDKTVSIQLAYNHQRVAYRLSSKTAFSTWLYPSCNAHSR